MASGLLYPFRSTEKYDDDENNNNDINDWVLTCSAPTSMILSLEVPHQ